MGCSVSCLNMVLRHHQQLAGIPQTQQYSWEKRRANLDPANFVIQGLSDGAKCVRHPGSINGEQMVIRNCQKSAIYLFDHLDSVTIDDCEECRIFIGPTKGSLFIRNCSACCVVAICGQFRTRDCHKVDVFLSCCTQPIIESSSRMRFGCLQFWYPELRQHFDLARMSPFNNFWWNIHDFTPCSDDTRNWSLITPCYKVHDFMPLQEDDIPMSLSTDREKSVVPLTVSGSGALYESDPTCALLIVDLENKAQHQEQVARKMLSRMTGLLGLDLMRTSQISLKAGDVAQVIGEATAKLLPEQYHESGGSLLAFLFRGIDCMSRIQTELPHLEPVFPAMVLLLPASQASRLFRLVDSKLLL